MGMISENTPHFASAIISEFKFRRVNPRFDTISRLQSSDIHSVASDIWRVETAALISFPATLFIFLFHYSQSSKAIEGSQYIIIQKVCLVLTCSATVLVALFHLTSLAYSRFQVKGMFSKEGQESGMDERWIFIQPLFVNNSISLRTSAALTRSNTTS